MPPQSPWNPQHPSPPPRTRLACPQAENACPLTTSPHGHYRVLTEEQMIGILKQHEAGVKTADLCREHGISAATFYAWKSKYGGMEVGEAQRLKQLEEENQRLKHLVADLSLDREALKAVIRKNGWSL